MPDGGNRPPHTANIVKAEGRSKLACIMPRRIPAARTAHGGAGFLFRRKRLNLAAVPGLYIHIPFCRRACGYCDFFKSISLAKRPQVLEALRREMDFRAERETVRRLDTVYFGGGTPSTLAADELGLLLGTAKKLWDCSGVTETTLEANPDDLAPDYLHALRETGFDRLSMGIQSLSDRELRLMNRRHDAAGALRAFRDARRAGFGNISIDLIYGLPGSDAESWGETLRRAAGLGAEHISAYHLTIEPGTAFGRRADISPVPEAESERQYDLLRGILADAGYEHYEISNFALPGFRSRHNSSYWADEPYIGVGPSAHSYDGRTRSWAPASLERYVAEAGTPGLYESETLTPAMRRNEYVMVRLRTAEGIVEEDFARRFGARELLRLLSDAERFLQGGLLTRTAGRLAVPPEKYLVGDGIVSALFR